MRNWQLFLILSAIFWFNQASAATYRMNIDFDARDSVYGYSEFAVAPGDKILLRLKISTTWKIYTDSIYYRGEQLCAYDVCKTINVLDPMQKYKIRYYSGETINVSGLQGSNVKAIRNDKVPRGYRVFIKDFVIDGNTIGNWYSSSFGAWIWGHSVWGFYKGQVVSYDEGWDEEGYHYLLAEPGTTTTLIQSNGGKTAGLRRIAPVPLPMSGALLLGALAALGIAGRTRVGR